MSAWPEAQYVVDQVEEMFEKHGGGGIACSIKAGWNLL